MTKFEMHKEVSRLQGLIECLYAERYDPARNVHKGRAEETIIKEIQMFNERLHQVIDEFIDNEQSKIVNN